MSSGSQSPSHGVASTVPLKRPHEDDHAPTISSPLNPNPSARTVPAPTREQRAKKESLKKREASESVVKAIAPEKWAKSKKKAMNGETLAISPVRYNHPLPMATWQYSNKNLPWAACEPDPIFTPGDRKELLKPLDHPENRKNFRYIHCVGDQLFKHSHFYRQSDLAPYGPRMSRSDSDRNFLFDGDTCRTVTNPKGWRMSRANVVAREGCFYYEIKILDGVPRDGTAEEIQQTSTGPIPHIRAGWARRESPLDAPVGFDGYSYGMRDLKLEPMHRSRASKFVDDGDDRAAAKKKTRKKGAGAVGSLANMSAFASDESLRTGDVLGLSITLPSLALHRKVVDGTFNPAVDKGAGASSGIDSDAAPNIVRDRIPIAFKGAMYFEALEYRATKKMDEFGDRGPTMKETPTPNHPEPALRTLPGSSIKVWKNGKRIGTAFRDLLAFLPPASQPAADKGVRLGQDDGFVGYFPAVSVFSNAIAEVNFGPDFWYPPEEAQRSTIGEDEIELSKEDSNMKQETGDVQMSGMENPGTIQQPPIQRIMTGINMRYNEQIAEDVTYDIIDEVDFFVQDGGTAELDGEGDIVVSPNGDWMTD